MSKHSHYMVVGKWAVASRVLLAYAVGFLSGCAGMALAYGV